jgi:hypothetical protein
VARNGTTWAKGIPSPNPNGRPPAGQSPTAILRRALEQEYRPGITRLQFLVEQAVDHLITQAERGDVTPADLAWITDRLDGRAPPAPPSEEALERERRREQRANSAAGLAALKAHQAGLF